MAALGAGIMYRLRWGGVSSDIPTVEAVKRATVYNILSDGSPSPSRSLSESVENFAFCLCKIYFGDTYFNVILDTGVNYLQTASVFMNYGSATARAKISFSNTTTVVCTVTSVSGALPSTYGVQKVLGINRKN